MSRGERRTVKAESVEDILRQPDPAPSRKELMEKKKKEIIKKYGKPIRNPNNREEIIRRYGKCQHKNG